jgi:hypothetical protein
MVRARAASHSGISIPFGAAHRVNFDTPPLKGLRMEPFRFHLETFRNNGAYRGKLNLLGSIGNRTCKWNRR